MGLRDRKKIEVKQKTYVTLQASVSEMSTQRNSILFGFPPPSVFLSFIINLLMKSGLTDNYKDIGVLIGVNNFEYTSETQRGINQDKNIPKLIKKGRSMLDFKLTFSFLTDERDKFKIEELLKFHLLSCRLSSGSLVLNEASGIEIESKTELLSVCYEKDKAIRKMIPTFIMKESPLESDNLKDLIREITEVGSKKELISAGKSFISNIEDKEIYAEEIYGAVSFKALTTSNISSQKFWRFESTENYILTKTGE